MNARKYIPKFLIDLANHAKGRYLVLSSVVGLLGGLGAVAFYFAANSVDALLLGGLAGYNPPSAHGPVAVGDISYIDTLAMHHRWVLFLLPALGGLVSGYLVYKFAPEAEGHGTDAAIDSFHRKGGHIRARVPWIKALASVATIGTGGSAGREGPIAQIGAGIGSWIGAKLGLSAADRRILLLAGIAAGVGATFRAPLAGALFAVEVLYRETDFEHEALIPSIIASIVAYSMFGAVTGWEPLLDTPLFAFEQPRELILYLALGIFCALLGVFYVRFFYKMRDLFALLPVSPMFRPAIGGLALGVLAFFVPQVLGSGYGWVQAALYGKIALWVMLTIAIAKIVATSLTIPSGGSGGVFAPSLVIGALLGGTFGATAEMFFPAMVADPRSYVLVGMAGFFAGVSNTPIATLIMVSELTGNYGLLAPLMLVCVISMIIHHRNTIYENQVLSRSESPAHKGDFVVDVLEGIKVSDLAEQGHQPLVIEEYLTLSDILNRIAVAEGAYYPVVDTDENLTGIFSVNDIRRILDEEIPPGLVCAKDIATPKVITVFPDDPMNTTLQLMSSRGLEEIPVVDRNDPSKILFMLTRRALLARYARELESKKGFYQES
ncbi:MAG: chloride channel protein [Desulfuromonas sp.]|nr:MAG: chloride channel protein [Desulfuromonas sp.]